MPALSDSERFGRLEQVVLVLAEGQVSLETIVADLATSMRLGFDQVAAQQRLTTEHMRQTDERMRQTDERFRQTDERIDKLVVAIGQLIQRDRN